MSKLEKLLMKILTGRSDSNIPFDGLCRLLRRLGFDERVKGDHHIFTRPDIEDILNIQPKGTKAKPYQVRQLRNVLLRYRLGGLDDDQI